MNELPRYSTAQEFSFSFNPNVYHIITEDCHFDQTVAISVSLCLTCLPC